MNDECVLSIKIKNTEPVELVDLTNSLLCLADEYKHFIGLRDGPPASEEIKLYIKEIKTNCIITDLIASAPGLLPFMGHAMTVIDFTKFLKDSIGFFIGGHKEFPELDMRSYKNITGFLEPVAKDNGSQLNLNGTINGGVHLHFDMTSDDANAVQRRISRKMDQLKEPATGEKSEVLLYWYQARNDPKSVAGDRAIVESISKMPVKTIMNPKIKKEMLSGDENPFNLAYIVDLKVETINDNPRVYKITHLHYKEQK